MNEEEQKNTTPTNSSPESTPPADALSLTPDELEEEQAAVTPTPTDSKKKEKKPGAFKRLYRKVNLYFLLFLLIVVIGAAITIVNYLNSQKEPVPPSIASQELSEEELKNLANTDTSVGDSSQTLTIRGNAIIDGQTLMRGNLNVAGNFQAGGSMQSPSLTISGSSNLGTAQINTLQVANDVAIQGSTTMSNISVSGTSTFNGPMTASQITASRIIMSGNATLEVPNHISFTGPSPSRSVNASHIGSGGTASVSGSDTAGTVRISTGNSPSAGCMVRITFNQPFTSQPRALISPVGVAAGRTQYYVERDQAGFSICASSPAPGNQTLNFDYFIAG